MPYTHFRSDVFHFSYENLCFILSKAITRYIIVAVLMYKDVRCSLVCLCGSVRDSELGGPGSLPQHGSHCVIEAGGMCKLTVALISGRLVH